MQSKEHWEQVYTTKSAEAVSWFQTHAELSLNLIKNCGIGPKAAIIDVGGGASTLVDDLLAEGYIDLTVLDLSSSATDVARERLGKNASKVNWIEADITQIQLQHRRYDIWHDRAVFHFLTTQKERDAYVRNVFHSVKPGGYVIVATFAEDGPLQCSGLPVVRYHAEDLHDEFGDAFQLLDHRKEEHHTPAGGVQQFVYCYCRRAGT